jgi:hypothetical protein
MGISASEGVQMSTKEASMAETPRNDANGDEFSKRPSHWAARLADPLQLLSFSDTVNG